MTNDDIDSIMSPTIHDFRPSDGYIAPALDEDAEKARFEAWAKDQYFEVQRMDGTRGYWGDQANAAWWAWLAAKRDMP